MLRRSAVLSDAHAIPTHPYAYIGPNLGETRYTVPQRALRCTTTETGTETPAAIVYTIAKFLGSEGRAPGGAKHESIKNMNAERLPEIAHAYPRFPEGA